jgi:hypothetical protein
MGEAELLPASRQLVIHANIFLYGQAANEALAATVATEIAHHWNAARGTVLIEKEIYNLWFNIQSQYVPQLTEIEVLSNTGPRNNYFRVETAAYSNISYVDGIGCNTGYFLLDNLLNNSTTAAHEFGHTLGLEHPHDLDLRGKGDPGIMYPRGTIVDSHFQYHAEALPGQKGGTLNPANRVVQPGDIELLRLDQLAFNQQGFAIVGEFSSVWHEAEV